MAKGWKRNCDFSFNVKSPFNLFLNLITYYFIAFSCTSCSRSSADAEITYNQNVHSQGDTKPNIIFILADDAGWNDFSFHGSPQIPTPNIDAIALNGVILNSYYSSPLCTPSRGTTLTGKYAIHLGLQHYVITSGSREGLPLQEKLLPEYLKELGYSTHLVGKWHLGHSRKVYTPTYRGFDSHFGYYLGKQDYYSHACTEKYGTGYDFRSNLTVNRDVFGKYNTDIFTEEAIRLIQTNFEHEPLFLMISHVAPHSSSDAVPLQAPKENVEKFSKSIKHEGRRHFAGVVDKLDESVGLVVKALTEKGILNNSIIIFASDNGGAPEGYDLNQGSNWPLRGTKNTLWEGGTRLAACLWSPLLHRQPHVHNFQMHSADWLPTLLEAVGSDQATLEELDIDGVSQWNSILGLGQDPPPRNSFLYNIDNNYNNSAFRLGKWKLIQGNTSSSDLGGGPNGSCDGWYGPSGRDEVHILNEFKIDKVADLLPLILSSDAGKSFEKSGFPINEEIARQIQVVANIDCSSSSSSVDLTEDDGSDIQCNAFEAPCLFNIEEDPCERRNVAREEPEVVEYIKNLISDLNQTAIPPMRRWNDPNCAASKWGYIWTWFLDLMEERN